MGLGLPFQGTVVYKNESGYNTPATGAGYLISDKIYDVRIDWGDTFKALRGISEPSVCAFISTPSDPTLHLEWVPQQTANSLATYCMTRTLGTLTSLTFDIGANTKSVTQSYYKLTGAVCKTFNMKASTGNEWILTADFSVASITTSTTSTLTGATGTLGTAAYAFFNKAGNLINKNTSTAIATIVDSVDITINNNTTDYWDHHDPNKVACVAGALDVTGSMDVSLDDGGKSFADAIWTDLTNITVDWGLTNYDTWTFVTGKWDGLTIDINNANDRMKTPAKFRSKNVTVA